MSRRKILCVQLMVLFFLVISFQGKAQEKHFIYIQSENKQPFYVQMNDQNYSSTASGYVIIPQLLKGKYYLVAGFAKNLYPEQKFTIDLNKDAGYSLKQFEDKKWGLFDIVAFNTIMADNGDSAKKKDIIAIVNPVLKDTVAIAAVPQKDTLIRSTDDAGLSATKVSTTETLSIKKDTIAIVAPITDTQVAINVPTASNVKDTVAIIPVKDDTLQKEVIAKPVMKDSSVPATIIEKLPAANNVVAPTKQTVPIKTNVAKFFERTAATGIDQIYIDNTNKKKADTIAILIPLSKDTVKAKTPVSVKTAVTTAALIPAPEVKKCKVLATDDDFYRVRLDMASATTNDAMILFAKNYFKVKCYSVEQIKNLGVLFLSEESRCHFFEAAQPYISDSEKYPSLQLQFTQAEWIEKFRASVKKN